MAWWGILSPAEAPKLIAEFNKIYPFIRVNYWRGKGEEIASKLEGEYAGGRPSGDISLGGEPYNYPRWRKMGMLDKFTDIIPGMQKMDKRNYSRYGDWIQPGNNGVTPHYNTNKVSAAEAPKSWEDLLNPKWKGQLSITTDPKVWVTLAVEEGGWGLERTEDFLRKLKQQQLIWSSGHSTGHSLLIAGDFKILGEDYVYHTLLAKEAKGAPVEWSRVRPVPVTGPSIALMKKAPHPNAAKLLLEWLFSPQGILLYDKITYYGVATPGSGTRLSKALEGLPLVYRTEEGIIKSIDMGLEKRFADILGARPE
jgi:ABC-type Fe3+ transport system substrate-binding protein